MTKQDLIKINTIKKEGEDKFIITVGYSQAVNKEFNSPKEAEEFLRTKIKLNVYELQIIGALCTEIVRIIEEQKK